VRSDAAANRISGVAQFNACKSRATRLAKPLLAAHGQVGAARAGDADSQDLCIAQGNRLFVWAASVALQWAPALGQALVKRVSESAHLRRATLMTCGMSHCCRTTLPRSG